MSIKARLKKLEYTGPKMAAFVVAASKASGWSMGQRRQKYENLTRQEVTALAKQLEADGYIVRVICPCWVATDGTWENEWGESGPDHMDTSKKFGPGCKHAQEGR